MQMVWTGPHVSGDQSPEMHDGQAVGVNRTTSLLGHEVIHHAEETCGQEKAHRIVAVPPLHQRIHRTAERVAIQTGRPVVAVSELRRVATVFYAGQKIELASPTVVAAKVNQELQALDRLRRRLDEAERRLTHLEVTGLATYRTVVEVVQRAELVGRVGAAIERETVTLGDEGRLAWLQLIDLVRGVEHMREVTLRDYVKPRRERVLQAALDHLQELSDAELEDPVKVGKALGFPELDDEVQPRGYRLLAKVGRLPESVRDEVIRHFRGDFGRMLRASVEQFERVEGVGRTRATQLRRYLDNLVLAAGEPSADLG